MSCMTSFSKNEMNIQISLCKVQYMNGILKIPLEIFPEKDISNEKKIQNTWETIIFYCNIYLLQSFKYLVL